MWFVGGNQASHVPLVGPPLARHKALKCLDEISTTEGAGAGE